MRRSSISGVSEAGPIVATILVLFLGSVITAPQMLSLKLPNIPSLNQLWRAERGVSRISYVSGTRPNSWDGQLRVRPDICDATGFLYIYITIGGMLRD